MPVFKCEECGYVDNTAVTNYWCRELKTKGKALCSLCDPEIKKWHGFFPRKKADGYLVCRNGFLYSRESVDRMTPEERERKGIVLPL